METFLPYVINKAFRDKDESKVKTLGPYVYLFRLYDKKSM
jgi:hypothetical protein